MPAHDDEVCVDADHLIEVLSGYALPPQQLHEPHPTVQWHRPRRSRQPPHIHRKTTLFGRAAATTAIAVSVVCAAPEGAQAGSAVVVGCGKSGCLAAPVQRGRLVQMARVIAAVLLPQAANAVQCGIGNVQDLDSFNVV